MFTASNLVFVAGGGDGVVVVAVVTTLQRAIVRYHRLPLKYSVHLCVNNGNICHTFSTFHQNPSK